MDKNEIMKAITAKLGQAQAIDTVMQAYNTELVTTWLSHLEPNKPSLGRGRARDHLSEAMKRVKEVCDLT